jgi:hypothetical protein
MTRAENLPLVVVRFASVQVGFGIAGTSGRFSAAVRGSGTDCPRRDFRKVVFGYDA